MINHKFRQRQESVLAAACNPGAKIEYLHSIKGQKIVLTDHAKDQARARHGMSLADMQRWFEDTVDLWASFPVEHYNQEIFVYSVKWQRGMILAYRRDAKATPSDKGLAVVAVTVYPYGKACPMQPDTVVVRG